MSATATREHATGVLKWSRERVCRVFRVLCSLALFTLTSTQTNIMVARYLYRVDITILALSTVSAVDTMGHHENTNSVVVSVGK